jgi:TRAP-type C4-dicarboxylate transport system substrate-binding protein
VDKKWIAKIEAETKGSVKIKPYWGETLVGYRDAITEIAKGVADMGFISPGYAKAGFPITRASYIFYFGANQEVGRKVFKEMLMKFPEIEQEYTSQGLKVLAWSSGADYQLITKRPVYKGEDLKGMRLKTLGEIVELLRAYGAEGTTTPASEVYSSMQKGILDGTLTPLEGLKTLRLAEVAKYCTMINFYRTHSGSRVINQSKWNSLPSEIKRVFEENIEFWGVETDRAFIEADKEGYEFGKKNGVQFITLSKEELERFYAPLKTIAEREASKLDSNGLPGTKIFKEAQTLIRKYSK